VVKVGTKWKVVKVGTKVEVNYGAGIPKEYGVVTAIKNAGTYFYAVIEGDGFTMTAHDIQPAGTVSANLRALHERRNYAPHAWPGTAPDPPA